MCALHAACELRIINGSLRVLCPLRLNRYSGDEERCRSRICEHEWRCGVWVSWPLIFARLGYCLASSTPASRITKCHVHLLSGVVLRYYGCSSRTSDSCTNVKGPAGYNCPSKSPYTIATGTTGGAFFGELYGISGNELHASVATKSVDYLRSVIMTPNQRIGVFEKVQVASSAWYTWCGRLRW